VKYKTFKQSLIFGYSSERTDNVLRHCGPHRERSPPRTIAVRARTAGHGLTRASGFVVVVVVVVGGTRDANVVHACVLGARTPSSTPETRWPPGRIERGRGVWWVFGGRAAAACEREDTTHHITPRTHTHTHASSAAERTTGENRSYCFARSRSHFISPPPPPPKHILLRMRVRVRACKYGTCACNVTSPIYTHTLYPRAHPAAATIQLQVKGWVQSYNTCVYYDIMSIRGCAETWTHVTRRHVSRVLVGIFNHFDVV